MAKHTRAKQPAITSVFDSDRRTADDQSAAVETTELNGITEPKQQKDWRRRFLYSAAGIALLFLVGLGVMAKNGWLPATDAMTGKKTGWFGKALPANASSSWNPMANPLPTATPTLSKEYVYAGSRLLAVEDANASASPPGDLAIWRPGTGVWWVMSGQGSQQVGVQWGSGTASDMPVPGDYDGDGLTDFSVWRPSTGIWYIIRSGTGNLGTSYAFGYGSSGDVPAQADYDGDGLTDAAVYRPSNGTWYIQKSTDVNGFYSYQLGLSTDLPAPADYDGDGKADVGIWRNSNQTFYWVSSGGGTLQYATLVSPVTNETINGSKVTSADYDGDGRADLAVYDSGAARWFIYNTTGTSTERIPWGNSGDVPVHNDYDGDGKVDVATWRNTNGDWYIRQSSLVGQSNVLRQVHWGDPGDVPVPAFYRR